MVERACPIPHSSGHGCCHTHCSHCSSKTSAQQAALRPSVHKLHNADGTCETRVPAVSDCLKLFEPGLNGGTHGKLVRAAVQSAVVRGSARGHARYSQADALYAVRDRPFSFTDGLLGALQQLWRCVPRAHVVVSVGPLLQSSSQRVLPGALASLPTN